MRPLLEEDTGLREFFHRSYYSVFDADMNSIVKLGKLMMHEGKG